MEFIADFHIHSRYSRATSGDCRPEMLDFWARQKGIDVLGTGDFTHPAWRQELGEKLEMTGDGLYALKESFLDKSAPRDRGVRFIISGEISTIYKKNGRTRKVHSVIMLPDLEAALRLSKRLEAIGNLHSDGRPILGLDCRNLLEITLDCCPEALFIPAHIWTPHFSLFGSNSGFDAIEECFEDLTGHIFALETGLSSDPPMNWRLSSLDRFALVSNSDAHSPGNLAREANVFGVIPSYQGIYDALKNNDREALLGTVEFFPEEGKYHFDGHRTCKIQWEPSRTVAANGMCPVCGGKLTVGVLHRVEELADRPEHFLPPDARRFERIVPLAQIIGSSIGTSAKSVKVDAVYRRMIDTLGPELTILRLTPLQDIKTAFGELMTEAVRRVRAGDLHISAGYDGEYGVVSIFDEKERADLLGQSDLFGAGASSRKTVRTKPADGGRKSQKKKEKSPENPEAAPQGTPARYGLNDRQWEAVSSERKAVMVIAGPGTGKTHTLVSRIAYLVDELSADPSSIVAITFTNKAAAEMRGRLSRLFAGRQAMPFIIGTFHGICLELLRKADPADPVSIVDQAAARTILQEVMAEIGAEMPVSEAARVISLAKASGPQGIETLTGDAQAAHAEYKRRLGSLGAMDFDDILLASYEKLRLDESGFSRACGRWKHLLVDEFQDINHLQFSLIKRWGRGAESLFVIGDPHQSIYGFRGSSPRYFGMFEKDFPEVSRISLSRNYRSPAAVVSAARSLISRADGGSGETMVAEATVGNRAGETESVQAGRGEAVRIVETKDEFSEALFITKEIGRMMGGIDMLDAQVYGSQKRRPGASNRGFADFAVIYRTHRQASIIEQCFTKEGIQYRVAGRSDLFDHAEVRRAIAFFRFVLDPDDICSFAQCLAGSGTERVHDILDGYIGAGRGLPALRAVAEIDGYAPQARNDLRSLDELIARFHPRIRRDVPAAVLRDWMTARGIGDDHPAFLIVHCAEMHDTMESFLRTLTLGRDADLVRNGGKTVRTDAVTLTTLHAAKGLEFPVVFLCGVNDGIIPIAPRAGEDVDIEEERRLFYVGVTRTREELICTWSRRRSQGGSPQPGFPSRFLKDMGETGIVRERYLPEPEARQMSFL